jgi:hypothetical protein
LHVISSIGVVERHRKGAPVHNLRARLRVFRKADRGSHSIEYVLVIGVGVALAAVLLKVVMSDSTSNAMFRLFAEALG